MDLFPFYLSDVVSSFADEKLETMPVEDAGEREEKQRVEPSSLSSLWGDAGSTQENSFARSLQMWYARGRENREAGPIWQCPSPPGRRSPTQRAHPTLTIIADESS